MSVNLSILVYMKETLLCSWYSFYSVPLSVWWWVSGSVVCRGVWCWIQNLLAGRPPSTPLDVPCWHPNLCCLVSRWRADQDGGRGRAGLVSRPLGQRSGRTVPGQLRGAYLVVALDKDKPLEAAWTAPSNCTAHSQRLKSNTSLVQTDAPSSFA